MSIHIIDAIGAFSISVANLIFWLLILPKQYHRPLVRSYFLWSLFITLWSFGYGMTLGGFHDYPVTLLWNRYCQAMATLIAPFYFKFSCSVVGIFPRYRKLFLVYLVVGIINALALVSTPSYVAGLWSFGEYPFQPLGGSLYFLFTGYFVWCTLHGFALACKYYHLKRGVEKKHVQLFLWASGIGYGGGFTLFLQGYRIPIPTTGVYLILAYVIIIGYSVFRYRFMDIEIIIKKTIVFAGIVATTVAGIAIPIALAQVVIGKALLGTINPFVLMTIGVATAIVISRPVERILLDWTDKYLFQKKVSYRKLLKEATEYLAHLKSLKRQARRIVTFLVHKARIANVSLYAYQSYAPGSLLLQASYPKMKNPGHRTIALSHPLANYLNVHRIPIELHSIEEAKADETDAVKLKELKEIFQLFKDHKAEAIIPCFGSDAVELARRTKLHLRGILFLGHQKSDQPYTEEDLDVFFTLGQESSIAFENARLYDEAITRSMELARANEELKRTNAELIRLNKELKEVQTALMEAKQRALVAGMGQAIAHEVNNPLNSVIMPIYRIQQSLDELQTLHKACESNPSERNRKKFDENLVGIKEGLARVSGGADRIKGIVNTLGDLVKVRTGEKKPVRLKLVVKCAWEEVKFQTYQETMAQPTINYDGIPASLPAVSGIVHDLQGVFANLFVNALHAVEKGERDKKITVEACEDPDSPDIVRIEFADNGCGMKPEVLANCFEHGYTTKGTKGTGIGLYYIKNIIEEVHGGTIEAKSEVGVGTTFIIRLPRYRGEAK